jgi:hypothetical protein
MRTTITITIAAALLTAAGTIRAENAAATEPGSEAASVIADKAPGVEFTPMTRSERFRHYLTGTFGPGAAAGVGIRSVIAQVKETPTEWKQNGRGFADRLGDQYAHHIIRGTLEYGTSTVLREDDRYLPSGQTGFWSRTKYAVSSTLLARRDNGQRTFALARMSSAAGTAFITRAWQPASTSGPGSAASNFGFMVAQNAGMNVIREFWPDLKRHFHRR